MVDADVDATLISGKNSVADVNAKQRAYYAKNREKVKANNRAWQERNAEKVKQYYKENSEKINTKRNERNRLKRLSTTPKPKRQYPNKKSAEELTAYRKSYNRKNKQIIKDKAAAKRQVNKGRLAEASARRSAAKRMATPSWVDTNALIAVYEACARIQELTGIQHHVDHIVPLKHDLVCGLHVPWNLQILTFVENVEKSNRLVDDVMNVPAAIVAPTLKKVRRYKGRYLLSDAA